MNKEIVRLNAEILRFRIALSNYATERVEDDAIYERAVQLLNKIAQEAKHNKKAFELADTWLTQGSTLVLQNLMREIGYRNIVIADNLDFNAFALLDTVSLYYHQHQKQYAHGGTIASAFTKIKNWLNQPI